MSNHQKKQGYKNREYPFPTKKYVQSLDIRDDPELIEEYKYWHNPKHIWPEIPKGIREVGILNMEIFLLENHLVMVVETPADFDWDTQMSKLAKLEKQEEWERFVDKYQLTKPGQASAEKWQLMERIFELPQE